VNTKHLYRLGETADSLGRSRSRIYELLAEGELEAVKDGRSTLITADSIDSFVSKLRGVREPPPADGDSKLDDAE
jgi:excisionase family DNA binding protein